ncbi:hypothetical protein [Vreelandella neptunia]|uniref:hypothetical protein n=1 Tax=Vreelandella neptunia TaxID=115551 RepID=UPI00315AAB02
MLTNRWMNVQFLGGSSTEVAFLISAIYTYPLYVVLTMSRPTDVTRFIEDLDGDVLAERLGKILSHATVAATDNQKKENQDAGCLDGQNIGSSSLISPLDPPRGAC